jgi:urease accessory protein
MVAGQPIASTEPGPAPGVTASPAAGLALMLLADGRFPAGGHAHSAGAEAACADGRIVDDTTLAAFVEGRLHTTGLVDAALGAATVLLLVGCRSADDVRHALTALDAEAGARIAAPPLRAASRKLGRQLVRVAGRCWPDSTLALLPGVAPDGVHQAVALGAVGVAAGLTAGEVARLSLHHAVTTPAQAAVRLLGLDPFGVAAVSARLAPVADRIADEAVAAARAAVGGQRGDVARVAGDPAGPGEDGARDGAVDAGRVGTTRGGPDHAGLADLPACSAPLVEIAAVEHRSWDVRMFAT